jgi:hypothetical protein
MKIFKAKTFIIIELSLIVIYLILNYFFGGPGALFHPTNDPCFNGMNCSGSIHPTGVSLILINWLLFIIFFLYLIVFLIGRIIMAIKKVK